MNYKVGDKVIIADKISSGQYKMEERRGTVMTIRLISNSNYFMVEDERETSCNMHRGWQWLYLDIKCKAVDIIKTTPICNRKKSFNLRG